jgi:hypothetical protein
LAVYIVTYDLNKEVIRPKIVDAIKKYGSWAMLSESSYAIATAQTAETVYDGLSPLLDNNDQLYVITLKRPYYGQGAKEVNDWLASQLSW